MTPSLLPMSASLLPQHAAFSSAEQAMLDELYDAAELDAVCDVLFMDGAPALK